jgi:MarR family transcriptional regulator, transcriptional regulator for hemolysin
MGNVGSCAGASSGCPGGIVCYKIFSTPTYVDIIQRVSPATAPLLPVLPEPLQPLGSDLCWMLSRASHSLTTQLTAALEGSGISPRGHAVLVTAMGGEHTQTDLARLVGIDKTTMMVTLDELEAAGLAERRPLSTDRRARLVVVTPAGENKLHEVEQIFDRVREDVLTVLSEPEREVFLRCLGRLACGRLAEPVHCSQTVRRPR